MKLLGTVGSPALRLEILNSKKMAQVCTPPPPRRLVTQTPDNRSRWNSTRWHKKSQSASELVLWAAVKWKRKNRKDKSLPASRVHTSSLPSSSFGKGKRAHPWQCMHSVGTLGFLPLNNLWDKEEDTHGALWEEGRRGRGGGLTRLPTCQIQTHQFCSAVFMNLNVEAFMQAVLLCWEMVVILKICKVWLE